MANAAPKHGSAVTWLAWLLLTPTVCACAGILTLEQMGCRLFFGVESARPAEQYGLLMMPLNALLFAGLGALINTFQPANRIGWLVSLYGFGLTSGLLLETYGRCGLEGRLPLPNYDYALWIGTNAMPFAFIMLALLPMLFPTGTFLSDGWRRFGLLAAALAIILGGLYAIWPAPMQIGVIDLQQVAKPVSLDISTAPVVDRFVLGSKVWTTLLIFLVGIVSLVLRWRRARGDERQQMKWLAFLLATSGVLFLAVEGIGLTVYPPIFDGWFYLIELAVFWLGLPIVLGLAIFKYRLYDIDIIIKRTLLYALVTALLVLVYFGSIVVLQRAFTAVTGRGSDLAIVISTLVIAILFTPLRLRLQNWIDRRFYRRRYDAEQALQAFALTARSEVDVDALRAELSGIIQQTIEPLHVSVWIRKRRK